MLLSSFGSETSFHAELLPSLGVAGSMFLGEKLTGEFLPEARHEKVSIKY
jgi:hypothetical protein